MLNSLDYRKKLFIEVIRIIKSNLETGEISAHRASEIARFVLQNLPKNTNTKEIFIKVPSFADQYSELAPVSLVASKDSEKWIQENIVPLAQKLISENRIAEANELMSKGLRNR